MSTRASERPTVVLTIGHSTRTLEELVELLRGHGAVHLVDIRTVPRSRHNPQFNRDRLALELPAAGLAYTHMPALGGLRHARRDSPNGGWRNASFRGFADYMLTPEFDAGLVELMATAAKGRTAIMCAEAVPWRCHRSLVADALTVRGVQVEHIMNAARVDRHALTPFAVVRGTQVTYPPAPSLSASSSRSAG